MTRYPTNGIQLEAQLSGPASGVPLVLVRGLGTQLIHWPSTLLDTLDAAGFRTCIFDNRDAGRSDAVTGPYSIADMADDVAGLLDALGWSQAHVAGVSLGGMVVQRCAIRHPQRFRSATSIMSSGRYPFPVRSSPEAAAAMAAAPNDPTDRSEIIDLHVAGSMIYDGTVGAMTLPETIAMETAAYDRAYRPDGVARQAAALAADGDRLAELMQVDLPFHVIHGSDDPLVPIAAGREVASAVPGARFTTLEGFGHVIGPYWGSRLAEAIAAFVFEVEARR